jgi:MATE family multidrug resistance protein
MREVGAAIATTITYILNMIIADIWIRAKSKEDGEFEDMVFFYNNSMWDGEELCKFLKVGVPGMFMLCFEWWAFELLAIFSGLLSVKDLAAEVVIINMITFIFMLPLGISYAASGLTGLYLGKGRIAKAKQYATMTILFNVICTSIICLILGLA